ncbi:nitrogen regulation protein [bacterium BMS3Bbin03]|nr:nitrogen regulation protein [bacterium BMS3Bbin03]
MDSSGTYAWTGQINSIFYTDIDGDGSKELIVFPDEAFAGAPRGVFVYDGHTFRLKWKYKIGPFILNKPVILDVNNDGKKEILFGTSAPCNGNKANGTDDRHSYLFLVDNTGYLLWRRPFGEQFTGVRTFYVDINGDGRPQVLAVVQKRYAGSSKPRIEIINPANGTPLAIRTFPYANPFSWNFAVLQSDRNPDKEFVISNKTGEVILLNSRFEEIRQKHLKLNIYKVYTCEDINGDGLDEIFIRADDKTYWLNNHLDIRASSSLHLQSGILFLPPIQVFHKINSVPRLVLFTKNGTNAFIVSPNKNSHYLLTYYAPKLIFASIGLLIIGLLGLVYDSNRRRKYYENLLEKGIALYTYPVLILDNNGQSWFTNSQVRELLNIQEKDKKALSKHLCQNFPEFNNFLKKLQYGDVIHHELELTFGEPERRFQIIAEPVNYPGKKRPFWVIFLKDASIEHQLENATAWAAMAQRIAHDIKNPLTSILLTQQRLEIEYKRQDPKRAKLYDPYTRRIINRIEALRRITREFMKFLSVEKINPQPTDLNAFIRNFLASDFMEWPDDIHVQEKLEPNLPPVFVDQEQLQTLLENILSNAINAMPEGGTITLATSLALNLRVDNQKAEKQNYIVLEIMDTGKGIPAHLRKKIFRPFTTGTHLGTGLGLTIVKKIVDDHNGHIEIESEEGTGTSIIVYLPVA